MIRNSNFYSQEYYNFIIKEGSVLTAVNCYNISKVDESNAGVINIVNQSIVPIPDAGCGFSVPVLDSYQPLKKNIIKDPEKQIRAKEKKDEETDFKMNQFQIR